MTMLTLIFRRWRGWRRRDARDTARSDMKLDRPEVNIQSSFSQLTKHRRDNLHMAAHVISFSICIANERM